MNKWHHTNRIKKWLEPMEVDQEQQDAIRRRRVERSAEMFAAAYTLAEEQKLRLNIRDDKYELHDDENHIVIVIVPATQGIHAFQHRDRRRLEGFRMIGEFDVYDVVSSYVKVRSQ